MKEIINKIVIFIGKIYFSFLKEKNREIKNVLVIAPGAIGDVLMSTPAIRDLGKKFNVDVLAGDWSKEILEGNPYIKKLIVYDSRIYYEKNFKEMYKLARSLRNKYDAAIIFELFLMPLFAYFMKIPIKVGIDVKGEGFALTRKVKYKDDRHIIDYSLEMAKLIGVKDNGRDMDIFLSKKDEKFADEFLRNIKGKSIGIFAGGGRKLNIDESGKRWPKERFVKICEYLINKGFNIILFGGKTDKEISDFIVKEINSNKIFDSTGKTSLKEAGALIKRCKLFICNDSGLLHIAAAVGTRTLCIFGATDSRRINPFGKKHIAVEPRIKPKFTRGEVFKDKKYIESVMVEDVIKKIKL